MYYICCYPTFKQKESFANLANFNLGPFQEEVSGKVMGVTRKFKETAGTLREFGQNTEEMVQKPVDKAVKPSKDAERKIGDAAEETVEKATDTVK